jgi:DNA gyrase subunit A
MPIVNLLPLAADERIEAIIDTREIGGERCLFFATRLGIVKKTEFSEYESSRRYGLEPAPARAKMSSSPTGTTTSSWWSARADDPSARTKYEVLRGVRAPRLRAGDEAVSCDWRDDVSILLVTKSGYGKRTQLDRFNRQGRGGQGVMGIRLTNRKGQVVAAFMVGLDDEIVAVTSGGTTIRMPVREISSQGRDATGVKVMNVDEGQVVASVAPILASGDE